jgi:hypothetical protein
VRPSVCDSHIGVRPSVNVFVLMCSHIGARPYVTFYVPLNNFDLELTLNCISRGTNVHTLSLEHVRSLHAEIQKTYDTWTHGDRSWFKDGFFMDSRPIFVTVRFGQNRNIYPRAALAEEASAWELERDYSKMRFVSMALATELT